MDNKIMPYEDWSFIGDLIERSRWIFAKTMPQNPHFYMLRKESVDAEFVRFVELIRKYGYRYKYGKTWYVQLNVGSWYYWTMGCPLHNCPRTGTILINRKERRLGLESPYDAIAAEYEGCFDDELSRDEDVQMADLVSRHNMNGRTLEIGCGGGMVTRNLFFNKEKYLGIDPSWEMLERFKKQEELSGLAVEHTDFESLYSREKFNFVFATYGAASYVNPEFWARLDNILEPGGSFLLMFYADGYIPATHIFTQTGMPYYSADEIFRGLDASVKTTHIGNYRVVEGVRR
jgi:SAM-dependent methyltransferase